MFQGVTARACGSTLSCSHPTASAGHTQAQHAERATHWAVQHSVCAETAPAWLQNKHHCLVQTRRGHTHKHTPQKTNKGDTQNVSFSQHTPRHKIHSQQAMHTAHSVNKHAGPTVGRGHTHALPCLSSHIAARLALPCLSRHAGRRWHTTLPINSTQEPP